MEDHTVVDESINRALEASKAGVQRPILIILDGGDMKSRFRIDDREIIVGRDVVCGITLADAKVSRQHSKFIYKNYDQADAHGEVVIKDMDSTNGTFVNGKKITEQLLCDRDKILIGSTLFGFFLRDESTLKADETLMRLASYDSLTGLRNRAIFIEEIRREFDRARRYGRPLSMVMFDIDHFKKFNDSYGHQVGDHVLKELGMLIGLSCRSNDLPARYGGEEFALILPETALENALIKAERLRKAIMIHAFDAEATRLSVTVSLGVSTMDEGIEDSDALIKAADMALYRAKEGGRNRVCWHHQVDEDTRLSEAG